MPYKDPVKKKEYDQKWIMNKYHKDPEFRAITLKKVKEARDRKRKLVIAYYGGKCVCCGESEYAFLSLDHVANDGAEHRRRERCVDTAIWALKNGCPDILQILCYNCNNAKSTHGICPHQLEGL